MGRDARNVVARLDGDIAVRVGARVGRAPLCPYREISRIDITVARPDGEWPERRSSGELDALAARRADVLEVALRARGAADELDVIVKRRSVGRGAPSRG